MGQGALSTPWPPRRLLGAAQRQRRLSAPCSEHWAHRLKRLTNKRSSLAVILSGRRLRDHQRRQGLKNYVSNAAERGERRRRRKKAKLNKQEKSRPKVLTVTGQARVHDPSTTRGRPHWRVPRGHGGRHSIRKTLRLLSPARHRRRKKIGKEPRPGCSGTSAAGANQTEGRGEDWCCNSRPIQTQEKDCGLVTAFRVKTLRTRATKKRTPRSEFSSSAS